MTEAAFRIGDIVKLDAGTCEKLMEVLHDKLNIPSISESLLFDFASGEFEVIDMEYVEDSDRYVYNIKPYAMPDITIEDSCFSRKFQFAEGRLELYHRDSSKIYKRNINSWRQYIKGG